MNKIEPFEKYIKIKNNEELLYIYFLSLAGELIFLSSFEYCYRKADYPFFFPVSNPPNSSVPVIMPNRIIPDACSIYDMEKFRNLLLLYDLYIDRTKPANNKQ